MRKAKTNLILTRPFARSKAFADNLRPEVLAAVDIHIAPVLAIRALEMRPDLSDYAGVIFSSRSAVDITQPPKPNMLAFCVGLGTTKAASEAGFDAQFMGETADELIQKATITRPKGPLAHLHGEHTRGNIASKLSSAGTETHGFAIYAQDEVTLPPEILQLLACNDRSVIPLFSPRSAALVMRQVHSVSQSTHFIVLSKAVAQVLPNDLPATVSVASSPTGAAMHQEVAKVIAA